MVQTGFVLKLQAVIFDFDGLIIDTETPEVQGWETEFGRHGLQIPAGWWAGLTGRGPDEVLEWPEDLLAKMLGRKIDREATLARVNEVRLAGIAAAPLRPGVNQVIEQAQAAGLKLGIASSSKRDWVEKHLSKHMSPEIFQAMACRGDAPRAKPHPDLYLLACERLSVAPAHAIALEDSPNGIVAAKAAGLYCVGVPNPVTESLDLSAADLLLTSLEDFDLQALA